MYNVHSIRATSIFLYFLWLNVIFVSFTNGTQDSKYAIEKIKLADVTSDKNVHNKTRLLALVKLVKSEPKKINGTKSIVQTKNNKDKNLKGSKVTLQEKSNIKNKLNATKNDMRTTKSNLRMGNRKTVEKWPKPKLRRDKGFSAGALRSTKMNMMQMDDRTPFPTLHPVQKLSHQEEDKLNEILSPYTIKNQMARIGGKFKDANVTMEVIGRTLEYNDIVLLKFAHLNTEAGRFRADDNKYVDDTNEKKIIFIVHGLSVMGMISLDCLVEEKKFIRLVSYYLEHLDKFDIFLIPMANPDGFANPNEMWNKNLSPQNACPGVALDRNFDVAWNSSKPISSCSQQYPGPAPFSEPESRAIRDILHRYSHKIIAYIHVHAGTYSHHVFKGDAVLYPRGYTDIQSDDDKYIDLKGEIDEIMRKASFQVYSVAVETLYNWYGRVSGASVDYASTVYGIPYALEFVMQLYEDSTIFNQVPSAEQTSYHVTVEVWKRVIDAVVNHIWNSLHSNEV